MRFKTCKIVYRPNFTLENLYKKFIYLNGGLWNFSEKKFGFSDHSHRSRH